MSQGLTRPIFAAVDAKDQHAFATFFADDGRLVFGNADPLIGREAITAGIGAFFSSIDGLRHAIVNEWHIGPDTVAETEVTYRRLDGRSVSIPAVSIWRTRDDGLIAEYRIFADLGPLYAP